MVKVTQRHHDDIHRIANSLYQACKLAGVPLVLHMQVPQENGRTRQVTYSTFTQRQDRHTAIQAAHKALYANTYQHNITKG